MRVMSTALPRKSNLAIAQAAAMPKTALSGTAMAATRRVSLMAASASRSPSEAHRGADALGQRLGEDDGEGREEQDRDEERRRGR